MTATISTKKSKKLVKAKISGELNIYSAMTLKDELVSLVQENPETVFNLSEVTELDTAGVQLLVLLKKESAILDTNVLFVEHSEPVIEVMELLDLTAYFGDPVVLTN